MSLQQQINTDIITAMKAKDEASLRALRALKSALLLAATAEGATGDGVSDEQAIKLFQKLAKQRRESMDIYLQNGREELAAKEKEEIDVIEKYLPKQMSEEEIKATLSQLIASSGASGPADFGKVMPQAMKALAGKADGKVISAVLKELLG